MEDNNPSKTIRNSWNQSKTPNDHAKQTMAPAANTNDVTYDAEVALQRDQLTIARALIEQQRQKSDAEDKIAAFVVARQIEARKEQELELALAIRRRHEDEQLQKQLLSLHREREIVKNNPELLAMALSAGDTTGLRADATSRLANELSLLRSSSVMGESSTLSQAAGSRLLQLSGYDGGMLSAPSHFLGSTHLSSRTSPLVESQLSLAERLQLRNNLQLNATASSLSHLYASHPNLSIPSSQDITALRNFYGAIAGGSNLSTMMHDSKAIPASMHAANLLTGAEAGLGSSLLRSPHSAGIASSDLIGIPSIQLRKHTLEGSDDLFAASKRLKTSEQTTGSGSDLEDEQQQKRFNKHQCKQWTLKFHELLAFKEKNGHCNVPHGYKDNLPLAMWVKRQRHQYNLMTEKKTSTLTGERIKLLENIGFVWNCLETAWDHHYKELCIFKMRTGHCSVPTTYKRNPRLASWVVTQRRQCKLLEDGKQSSMTEKRLNKLKEIDFPIYTKKTTTGKTEMGAFDQREWDISI